MGVLKFGDFTFNISTLDVDPKYLYDSNNDTYRVVIGDVCTPQDYIEVFAAIDKKSEGDFINDVTILEDDSALLARLVYITRYPLQYELEIAQQDLQFMTKEQYDTSRGKNATKGKKGKRKSSTASKSTRK